MIRNDISFKWSLLITAISFCVLFLKRIFLQENDELSRKPKEKQQVTERRLAS